MNKETIRRKKINDNLGYFVEDYPANLEILNIIFKRGKELEKKLYIDSYRYIKSHIETLGKFDIRGKRLYDLYNVVCNRDMSLYDTTIYMLYCDIYTKEEVLDNLDSNNPVSFVYDDYKSEEGLELYDYFTKQKRLYYLNKNKVNGKLKIR